MTITRCDWGRDWVGLLDPRLKWYWNQLVMSLECQHKNAVFRAVGRPLPHDMHWDNIGSRWVIPGQNLIDMNLEERQYSRQIYHFLNAQLLVHLVLTYQHLKYYIPPSFWSYFLCLSSRTSHSLGFLLGSLFKVNLAHSTSSSRHINKPQTLHFLLLGLLSRGYYPVAGLHIPSPLCKISNVYS